MKQLSFNFNKEAHNQLNFLQEKLGYSSKGKVIRNAIRLYYLWKNKQLEGWEIHLHKGSDEVVVDLHE